MVSAFDNSLSVIYQNDLMLMEKNPVGLYLLIKGLDVFVTCKAITTMIVVLFCLLLTKTKFRSAVVMVGLFQVGFFYYLNYSDICLPSGKKIEFSSDSLGYANISPVDEFLGMQKRFWTQEGRCLTLSCLGDSQ
jgi:hypothetical protein